MPDLTLALYLLLILPGRQLWRSLHKTDRPPLSRLQRYQKSSTGLAGLLLALAFCAWWHGHGPAALGLEWPLSAAGGWCLAGAALLLLVMDGGGRLWEKKMTPQQHADLQAKMLDNDMLPRSPAELRSFLLMALLIGAGWELLYRGFLMLVLAPYMGAAAAVILSALAYGAAHGYQNPKQITLSIVSALLFACGYALTHSLWWLMLIHAALPLLAVASSYKVLRRADAAQAAPHIEGDHHAIP